MMRPLGLLGCLQGLLAPRRAADADGRRDRLGLVDRVPQHQRSGPCRLHAQHLRQAGRFQPVVLLEPGPIGGDVAGVADRQAQPVRGGPQHIADLEGGALLALDPVGVERVDQADGMFLGRSAPPC